MLRRLTCALFVLFVAGPPGGPAGGISAAPSGAVVRYRDGRLSVRALRVASATLLAEIAVQTGSALRGDAAPSEVVTVSFDEVPLREALERLLSPTSFTLRYDDEARLRVIDLVVSRPPAGRDPPEIAMVAARDSDDDDLVVSPRSEASSWEPAGVPSPVEVAATLRELARRKDPDELASTMKRWYGDRAMEALADMAERGERRSLRRLAAAAMRLEVAMVTE